MSPIVNIHVKLNLVDSLLLSSLNHCWLSDSVIGQYKLGSSAIVVDYLEHILITAFFSCRDTWD